MFDKTIPNIRQEIKQGKIKKAPNKTKFGPRLFLLTAFFFKEIRGNLEALTAAGEYSAGESPMDFNDKSLPYSRSSVLVAIYAALLRIIRPKDVEANPSIATFK